MKSVMILVLLAMATADVLKPEESKTRLKRQESSLLESTVIQHSTAIQELQAKLAAAETTISSLTRSLQELQNNFQTLQSKVTTYDTTVAFGARISRDRDTGSEHGVALTSGQTVVFNEVYTNVGHAYDPVHGVFTAPVSGVYVFFLNEMSPNNDESLILSIVKDGMVVDKTFAEGSGDNWDQGSSQVILQIAAGQTVFVRQVSGTAIRGDWWTVFSGYLLHAD